MDISIPDSLSEFITQRVRSGGYPNADAFVADLVRSEAGVLDGIAQGEPLVIDRHFDRRLAALLDEAAGSGDYTEANTRGFDEMEREARSLIRREKTP